jgi:hypothetical protein
MIFGLVVIILEAVGLDLTKFGDTLVPSRNNYFDETNSTFHIYYETWYEDRPDEIASAVPSQVIGPLSFGSLDLSDVVMEFFRRNGSDWESLNVTCLILNWTKFLDRNHDLSNPCNYVFEPDEDQLDHLGEWDVSQFKSLWCSRFKEHQEDEAWNRSHDEVDQKKRYAARKRGRISVDSLSAYYGHNSYFVGVNAASFTFLAIAVILDFCTRDAEAGPGDHLPSRTSSDSSK